MPVLAVRWISVSDVSKHLNIKLVVNKYLKKIVQYNILFDFRVCDHRIYEISYLLWCRYVESRLLIRRYARMRLIILNIVTSMPNCIFIFYHTYSNSSMIFIRVRGKPL